MTTVAQIAARALNAIVSSITDVVHTASLSYSTKEPRGYDHQSGKYFSQPTTLSGRCLFDTVKPMGDIFGDYSASPRDELALLEGFSEAAKEGWTLTVGTDVYTVKRAQPIVGVSELVYAVVRKVP
jgi:hypothetical protein